MKFKKYVGHLCEIVWLDHTTFDVNVWRPVEEIKTLQPVTMKTVGYVLDETKKYFIVASTISNIDTGTGEFLILKGTVDRIKKLKKGN